MITKEKANEYANLMHQINVTKGEIGKNYDDEGDRELRSELDILYKRRRELIRNTDESALARS